MVVVAAVVAVAAAGGVAVEHDCVAPVVVVEALSQPFRSGAAPDPQPSPSSSWRPACCAEAVCAAEERCVAPVAAGSVVAAPFRPPSHR